MMKAFALVASFVALAPGCASAQQPLKVTGALVLRERIALPPQAEALVEIRQGGGAALAETRIPLKGRQPPIPFEIDASRATFDPARPLIVQGSVRVGGEAKWIAGPSMVEAVRPDSRAGDLELRAARSLAFSTRFVCNGRSLRIGTEGEAIVLDDGGQRIRLKQSEAASGVRYEAEGDPATIFWMKGGEASYTPKGGAAQTCREAAPQPRAQRLRGPWRIVELAGAPLAAGSQATLRMGPRDALSGVATCSRFEGVFFANAEGLWFGKIGVTPRPCPPALAEQDKAVLAALDGVRRAEARGPDRLVLMGEKGPVLTLAR